MSKAKTARRAKPKLDENALSFRELTLFVEDAVGFRLGVATYDTPATRDDLLAKLTDAAPKVHLSWLDLASTPDEKLLLTRLAQHLRDELTAEGKTRAVMVVNLESTLDYRTLGPNSDDNLAILTNANFQRDAYPDLCPVSVVFWLNSTATVAFSQHAPDLYDWRSATFRFEGPAGPGERINLESELIHTPYL